MEEVLTKIHQKEAAAVKRERTMAYAFSHQVCHIAIHFIYFFVKVIQAISMGYAWFAVEGSQLYQ